MAKRLALPDEILGAFLETGNDSEFQTLIQIATLVNHML